MARPPAMRTMIAHVARADPALARVIDAAPVCTLQRRPRPGVTAGDHFGSLAGSILYQQLAGKAAATIHARFLALFADQPEGRPTPEAVLAVPEEALRGAGLSGNKAASVRDLAAKVLDGTVVLDRIDRLGDDDIVRRLVAVRGIGRWTAEMFLMFDLGRPDIWPVDDFGVRKGWALAHGETGADMPAPKVLAGLGEVFRPYRSVAAWYCWRATELDLAAPGFV